MKVKFSVDEGILSSKSSLTFLDFQTIVGVFLC